MSAHHLLELPTSIEPELAMIIQQYKNVFEKPHGLPPIRSHDHTIPLMSISQHIWRDIAMDFIIGLPLSHGYSVILVVVDRLSKFPYFIPLAVDFIAKMVADLLIQHVIKINGVPYSIVSDRDKLFISRFWQYLFTRQGTQLAMSSAYHSQTDGQSEVLNKCLEMYA